MAVLSQNGQVLANATQRTIVFDTEAEFQAFKDSLPAGVNVFEAFDIYIRETAVQYAAGTLFKFRQAVQENVNLYVSPDGSGDNSGKDAGNRLPASRLNERIEMYCSTFDFVGNWLNINFAPGRYKNVEIFGDFLNCGRVTLHGEGSLKVVSWAGEDPGREYLREEMYDPAQGVIIGDTMNTTMGSAVDVRTNAPVYVENIALHANQSCVRAQTGSEVHLDGVPFEMLIDQKEKTFDHPYRALVVADGPGAVLVCEHIFGAIETSYAQLSMGMGFTDNFGQETFFLAINSGTIKIGPEHGAISLDQADPDNWGNSCYVAEYSIFRATRAGVIDFSNTSATMEDNMDFFMGERAWSEKDWTTGFVLVEDNAQYLYSSKMKIPHNYPVRAVNGGEIIFTDDPGRPKTVLTPVWNDYFDFRNIWAVDLIDTERNQRYTYSRQPMVSILGKMIGT